MSVRIGFKVRVSARKRRSHLYLIGYLALFSGVLVSMSLAINTLENALPRLLVHFILPHLRSIFTAFAVEAGGVFVAVYVWSCRAERE